MSQNLSNINCSCDVNLSEAGQENGFVCYIQVPLLLVAL